MPRTQRVTQYIQQLAYQSLVQHAERDERPEDVPPGPEPTLQYAIWNAASFSAYVPFRGLTNG